MMIFCIFTMAWSQHQGVCVSFKPIASIMMYLLNGSRIMVHDISRSNVSHHDIQISQRDIERIQYSDAFISLGDLYESFDLKRIQISNHIIIQDIIGLKLLNKRDGTKGYDGHFFLSLNNIKIIAKFLSNECQKIYSNQQELIQKNCDSFCKKIDHLHKESYEQLSKCVQKQYAISHDFLQYVDDEMGTRGVLFLFKGCSHHLSPRAIKRFKDEKFDSLIVDEEMPTLKMFTKTVMIDYTGRTCTLSKNLFFDVYRHIVNCMSS